MKKIALVTIMLALTACSSTKETEVAKVDEVLTDEEYFANCMDNNNDDMKFCKDDFIKYKLDVQCEVERSHGLSSRIKKKKCTTAAQRERIAAASEDVVRQFSNFRRQQGSLATDLPLSGGGL